MKPSDPPCFFFFFFLGFSTNTSNRTCNTQIWAAGTPTALERNRQRSFQLPEQSPEPAGPLTNTRGVKPGEHSASITPWWTPISFILSFQQHLMHIADIISEALGLSHCCSHVGMSWKLTRCMEMMTAMQVPDHSEKKIKGGGRVMGMATSYLRTLVLMLRVWKGLGCLSEEDVSALQHGTVFRGSKIGFTTNNVRG